MLEEGEQAVADGEVALAQPPTVAVARPEREHRVQISFQATAILAPRARLQLEPAAGEQDRAQQSAFRRGAKTVSPASMA